MWTTERFASTGSVLDLNAIVLGAERAVVAAEQHLKIVRRRSGDRIRELELVGVFGRLVELAADREAHRTLPPLPTWQRLTLRCRMRMSHQWPRRLAATAAAVANE